jgi:predicted ATPase
LTSVNDAISLAERLLHPLSQALALSLSAMIHQLRGERERTLERASAAMNLSTEQGFPYFLALGTILYGWALAQQGEAAGISQMRKGLAAYSSTGAVSFRLYHLALLAEGYWAARQPLEGLHALEEALKWKDMADERFYEPELYRIKGVLTLQLQETTLEDHSNKSTTKGHVPTRNRKIRAEAEKSFRKAIKIAREQRAKSYELRATRQLARLLESAVDGREAQRRLAEVYGWFTEGFDTADLKEAKALLDELSA